MRGKHFIALALLLVLASLECFSATPATPYIKINDRCTVVDLTSNLFMSHLLYTEQGESVYNEAGQNASSAGIFDDGYYYHKQNLAAIGMSNIRNLDKTPKGEVTLTVNQPAGGWFYTLQGGEEYRRPFGIDVFARGRKSNSDANIRDSNNDLVYSQHFGKQKHSSREAGSITIPLETVAQYDYIWWDISLVLDPLVEQDGTVTQGGTVYPLSPSNSYYVTSLSLTISCGSDSETYTIYLAGYYTPGSTQTTDMTAILMVTRKAEASNLDINDIVRNDREVVVAEYGFSSDSKSGAKYQNGKMYLFLSSSPNARASSSSFTLNELSPSGDSVLPNNSGRTNLIHYKAYLNSNNGNTYANSTDGRTVNGDTYRTSIEYSGMDTISTHNFLRINPTSSVDRGTTYYRFEDTGTISITIPSDTDFQERDIDKNSSSGYINLEVGLYTSVIYIHIVTDI